MRWGRDTFTEMVKFDGVRHIGMPNVLYAAKGSIQLSVVYMLYNEFPHTEMPFEGGYEVRCP